MTSSESKDGDWNLKDNSHIPGRTLVTKPEPSSSCVKCDCQEKPYGTQTVSFHLDPDYRVES